MDQEVSAHKVPLRPFELLGEAKSLLGDQYWLFVGITFVGILIGSFVPLGILLGPMMCGIHLCYIQRINSKPASFELLFKGFDFFVESLIATLIMVAVGVVVIVPVYIIFMIVFVGIMASSGGEPDPAAVLPLMMIMYPIIIGLSILVGLPFIFVYPLIVDRGLKAVPAVKASFRGVLTNAFGVFGLVFVYTVISFIASCLCYFPAIMFLPLSLCGIFLAYRKIYTKEPPAFM